MLAVLFEVDAGAQSFLQRRSAVDQEDSRRENMRELKRFEHTLDQFSFAMVVGDERTALRIKGEILTDMLREVEQSRIKVREFTGDPRFNQMNTPQYLNSGVYSKRNSEFNLENYTLDIAELVDRYRRQQIFYYEFRETEIVSRRGIENENKHRKIMYAFQETMKEDIEWSIKER